MILLSAPVFFFTDTEEWKIAKHEHTGVELSQM